MTTYRYAYCRANGQITISAPFADWDYCYGVYCAEMADLRGKEDLATFSWRGVWEEHDLVRVVSSELTGREHIAFNTETIMEEVK